MNNILSCYFVGLFELVDPDFIGILLSCIGLGVNWLGYLFVGLILTVSGRKLINLSNANGLRNLGDKLLGGIVGGIGIGIGKKLVEDYNKGSESSGSSSDPSKKEPEKKGSSDSSDSNNESTNK